MSKLDVKDLPNISHPFAEMSLKHAVDVANNFRNLNDMAHVGSLVEAREVILSIQAAKPGFNWITGQAALDVLDAAIDGRDLTASSRIRG